MKVVPLKLGLAFFHALSVMLCRAGVFPGEVTSSSIVIEVMLLTTPVIKSSGCKTLILFQCLFL